MFDAYTVKKVLPKIVIAIILMQLSWDLAVWVINIANDVGHGIQDVMYAPFGGIHNMELENLVAALGKTLAAPLTVGAVFVGLILANAIGGLTLAGIGLFALGALLSGLVALLVLLLRQALIILCVILFPLALVLWILPGTERYWKMWYENFSKLLIMFPLIAGMIAAGRIFAYITASAGGGSGGAFLAVFGVMAGFFGPLFLLPKAFSWGGSAMSAVGNNAFRLTGGIRQAPGKYAKGIMGANREFRRQERNQRLSEGTSTHPRTDRMFAGGYNYALLRGARQRRFEANRAKGREEGEKEAQQAIIGSEYERRTHPDKLDALTEIAQGKPSKIGIDGTDNPILQRWALDELAKYGDWDKISELRDTNAIKRPAWEAFVSKNISGIHQNAPHLSPQRTDLSEQSVEDRISYKDYEQKELAEQAIQGYTRDASTGAQVKLSGQARVDQAKRHLAAAQTALGDSQIRRRMTTEGIKQSERIVEELSKQLKLPAAEVIRPSGQGAKPTVLLPSDLSTAQAKQSITEALSSTDRDVKISAGEKLTRRIAEADHSIPAGQKDEADFVSYMNDLSSRASGPNGSAEAARIYNDLNKQLEVAMKAHVAEVDRSSVEANIPQTQADALRANAIAQARAKWTTLGLPGPSPF